MTINLHLPQKNETLRPTITVIGVGGAGGNAVNNMIESGLEGVRFVAANTDAQALDNARAERCIQLGVSVTQGLGAGASPDVGRAAAEEAIDDIHAAIEGSHMVFITAGMGGGTGTGAAPVVARMAREQGILTVGVVTRPFQFEGAHRMKIAEQGLDELQNYVDTMIVIPNQNLFRVANERTTFADAFRMADEVLHSGVRGVTDLMVMPGLINLDFADIRAVMGEMGKAMMGTGEAEGERRAVDAAEAAISNPLLDDVSMKGARGVLINITGGHDLTLFEVDEAVNRIGDEVDAGANIIFGSTFHDNMEGRMRVSVVATGIDVKAAENKPPRHMSNGMTGGGVNLPRSNTAATSFHFGYTGRKEPEKATGHQQAQKNHSGRDNRAGEKEHGRNNSPSYAGGKDVATAGTGNATADIAGGGSEAGKSESPAAMNPVTNKVRVTGYNDRFSTATTGRVGGVTASSSASSSAASAAKQRQYDEDEQRGFAFADADETRGGMREPERSCHGSERHYHEERETETQKPARRDGGGFVPPQPSRPASGSFYQVTEEEREMLGAAPVISPRSQRRERSAEAESGGSALGFLQRMAGRAFSGGRDGRRQSGRGHRYDNDRSNSRDDMEAVVDCYENTGEYDNVSPQSGSAAARADVAKSRATAAEVRERELAHSGVTVSEEEAYLEIPAFLRRQAN